VSHARAVPASPCAGTDGWAILAEPPGVRDLGDARYWESSLDRSLRRRGSRPVRFRGGRELRVAAALAVTALVAPGVAGASSLDLSRGSSGAAVQQLQAKLGITADGAFGPQTEAAVRAFQRSHGLPVTGLVGPLTRAALGEDSTDATGAPASTAQVRALQQRLGVTVDGVMGPETRAAMKAYESSHGVPADETAAEPAQPTASSKGATAVQAALSKVGASYSYGATGPSSFDCSGLVMWAFRQAGVSMPHSSFAQYGLGQSVSRDQIQPGDLVFFNTAGAGASDVGIATSPTQAVSATTHGVMTHAILSGYWGSHYVGARRVA
jgi:cell wall-associated NlpC family hydrolase